MSAPKVWSGSGRFPAPPSCSWAVEPAAAGRRGAPAFSIRAGFGVYIAPSQLHGVSPARLSRKLFCRTRAVMNATPSQRRAVLIFAAVALVVGVVETFVRPKPSWFGEVMLVFAVALGIAWWAAKSGSRRGWLASQLLVGVGLCAGLYDLTPTRRTVG